MRLLPITAIIMALGLSACGHPSSDMSSNDNKFLHVAQAAEDSGDNDLALSIYAKAAMSSPHDGTVQLQYANALIKSGKIAEARAILAKHMGSVSDAAPLHGALGMIDVLQGDATHALGEFDAAHSDDPRWVVNKAVALDMLGRHADAQALYRGVLTASPDDAVVINDLSLSLLLSGHKAEAMAMVRPLAGRTDLSARVQADVGVIMAVNGDLAGAHQAIGSASDDSALARITTALNKGI